MKRGSTVLEVCNCQDYAWPHVHLDQPIKLEARPKRARRATKAEKVTRGDLEWLTGTGRYGQ